MKLFRFIMSGLLALCLVLMPVVSSANAGSTTAPALAKTLPTGFKFPPVSEIAKRMVSRANVVNYAVESLLGAVDWVLDYKNNRIIYKQSETDGKNCSAWHGDKTFTGDLKQVGDAWCQSIRDYNNPAERFKKISHVQYSVGCKGGAGGVIVHCELGEGSVSFNDIAEQIIKNAKAGHAESVDFVVEVANELALLSQHGKGNKADSGIEKDYNAETNNGRTQEKCEWLKANQYRYSADRVKATAKAWKCRHSRQSKD
ncbi:polymorphic toxin type 34 domain-containing protein [Moraxella sp. ZY210820]|uniref:polymorphic toxin type 34 domain-containing protein n=1 Tax=unclassified Moraxella TaxID=2685852 RepID=UPI002730B2CB|nr:polymorphic toxin type 34 domain-containing protein [Moraxella sp. ZY210820]WLF84359.1 polymorphic toxin type 34 domain-containing protein [Moraxella sp. ZY210820]